MLKKCLLVFSLFLFTVQSVHAIYDPRDTPNNRFGIHIIDDNDLTDAANLLNSTGGDWGYVKIVIREDDRGIDKWQNVFNRMRRAHLIPIVRLATKVENGVWVKPRTSDIEPWMDFLNSLNWVIENRYVIIFNEPNHASEWGGNINPEEYAWYLKEFSSRLKEKSPDFFILPAGLDASAPNGISTLDEATFIRRMVNKEPDVFLHIDGWTSHSYPNPGFSGSVYAQGKGTVRTFEWEMNSFGSMGIRDLPIFITETGWRHNEGKQFERFSLSPEEAGNNLKVGFEDIWNSRQVVAVLPFLLNYQDVPFDHFSWKKLNSSEFYPIYEKVQGLAKIKGKPRQFSKVEIVGTQFPDKLVTDSDYSLYVTLKNDGQSILESDDGWNFGISGFPESFSLFFPNIKKVEPGQLTTLEIRLKTPKDLGSYSYKHFLKHNEEVIIEGPHMLDLIPPPGLLVNAQVWFKKLARGNDFQLIIYDEKENIVHESKSLDFIAGQTTIENVHSLIPGRDYRLVLVRPSYLPRQIYAHLTENQTTVYFPQLLPFDPSQDGKMTIGDLGAFLKKPFSSLGLILAL